MKRKAWWKLAIIGLIIGILDHIVLLFLGHREFILSERLGNLLGTGLLVFCKTFRLPAGEPCGWAYLFWFPVILAMIGLVVGIFIDAIYRLKNEK